MKKGSLLIPGRKKTPFQKHKEAEADRKKREEAEAAKVYEDFVESFGADPVDAAPTPAAPRRRFGSGPMAAGPARAPLMQMSAIKSEGGMSASTVGQASSHRQTGNLFQPGALQPPQSSIPPSSGTAKGGKRQIDLVMEAIKGEQEKRSERKKQLGESASTLSAAFGDVDPIEEDKDSTNLYVGNLAQAVTEEILLHEFGRFGPIASVKIMWPRSDDERRRSHNSGFVAFMTRAAAEAAVKALHGFALHGSDLKIGFGKAVAIPPYPIYPPPAHIHQLRERVNAIKSQLPKQNGQHAWGKGQKEATAHDKGVGPDMPVVFPSEGRVCFIIDTLARYVIEDGTDFEQLILEAEYNNPEYDFLRNVHSPEHLYYRWRLWSLCNDDSLTKWRSEPFVMIHEGPRLVPPPTVTADATSNEMTAAQLGGEKERDRPLSDLERERLEDMLRQLRVERSDIENAMVFALDHADSAGEAAQCLVDSLTLSETPLHLKIARLYLLSDILHNSTAPVRNASRYRALLQSELPQVFLSMHEALEAQESRMTQEALKKHVLRVLRVWRDWYLFAEELINGLQALFLMTPNPEWDALIPEKIEEWKALEAAELERVCRAHGLPCNLDDSAASLRYLVMHYVYSTYGASGPPAAAVQTAPETAPAASESKPVLANPLVAGYESDGEATPPKETVQLEEGQTIFEHRSDMQPAAAPLSKWEAIDDEPEQEGISTSQWLADKQAKAQAEAEAEAQRVAEEERRLHLARLEEETLRLQQEAEEAQKRQEEAAAFALAHPEIAQQPSDHPVEPGEVMDGMDAGATASPGAAHRGVADSDLRRKQRDIEVKVVMLQEDLEERGVARPEIERRCSDLRSRLMSKLEPSDDMPSPHTSTVRDAAYEKPAVRDRRSARDGASRDGHSRADSRSDRSKDGDSDIDGAREPSTHRDVDRERERDHKHDRDDRSRRDARSATTDRYRRPSERERDRDDRHRRDDKVRRDAVDERSRRSRSPRHRRR